MIMQEIKLRRLELQAPSPQLPANRSFPWIRSNWLAKWSLAVTPWEWERRQTLPLVQSGVQSEYFIKTKQYSVWDKHWRIFRCNSDYLPFWFLLWLSLKLLETLLKGMASLIIPIPVALVFDRSKIRMTLSGGCGHKMMIPPVIQSLPWFSSLVQ